MGIGAGHPVATEDDISGTKAAEAIWFGTALSPLATEAATNKPTVFKITLSISVSAVIQWTWDNGSNYSDLNSGTAIGADQTFAFKVSLRNGDQFNLRTKSGSSTATIDYCRIDEYPEES